MSLATISTAPEAADPSAPGFKRYWRSWLERTAGQQANRSGGCQARFVKLFSAQVDDAVGGASEEAASAVRRLAGEWGYRARHEIEYEERWGREQEPPQWFKHPFVLCFALGVPIPRGDSIASMVVGLRADHAGERHFRGCCGTFSTPPGERHAPRFLERGLILLAIFLPPVAPFADLLQRLVA
jgi:hypothetical protein